MSEYKKERSRGEEMNVARKFEEMQKQIDELKTKKPTEIRTNETTTSGTLAPRKVNDEGNEKRTKKRIPIELKKRIIAKRESGMRIKDIASHYGMPQSTISTFLKNKEVIKSTKSKETEKGRELPPKATTSKPSPSTSSSHGIKRPASEKLDFTQQQPEIFKKRNTFGMKEKQDLFYLVLEGIDWEAARNKMILWEHEPRTAEEYKNRVKYQFKK
ncbi:uncharacterized protein LOC129923335 isoform X2 [Biomphalaria glabrata]|nr:uncharacterized protein LOC129923335 isoform X2 [Biomphalaria glabrata]